MKTSTATGVGILILDDDVDVVDYLASVLDDSGYTTHKARTTQEALALLEACPADRRPAVAIVDLILDNEHGMNAAIALVNAQPTLKVLLISGYADNVVTQPLPNGVQPAFLTKVFSAGQLRKAVADLVGT